MSYEEAETSIFEQKKDDKKILIYPCPAARMINITNLNEEQLHGLEIIDLPGNIVKAVVIQQNTSSIDISGLSSGMYILRLEFSDNTFAFRRILKK